MKKSKFFYVFFLTLMLILASTSFLFAETLKELYEKGAEAYSQGNYTKAIEYFEAAVKVNPNFAPAYNALGLAYRETNPNIREVAWYFKTAVDIDPNFADAHDNLAKAYYGMGQFDKAETSCKKALEIYPELGSAQFSLAWIYLLGKSRPVDAIFYFKKVLEKAKIPNAYFGLGMAYFMAGNRAMVLEMITMLRGAGEEKYAEQLENIVRDYQYAPSEAGGALIKIEPPPAGEEDIQPPSQIPQGSHDLGGQVMRVQMKGNLVDLDDVGKDEAKTPNTSPIPAPKNTPSVQKSSSSSGQEGGGSSSSGRRTIEILNSGY